MKKQKRLVEAYIVIQDGKKVIEGIKFLANRNYKEDDSHIIVEDDGTIISGKTFVNDDYTFGQLDDYSDFYKKQHQNVEKQQEISSLKAYLSSTDYIALKMAECYGDDKALKAIKAEYSEELAERKKARARINELEASL
mgnify:CR=1 FL=1